LVDIKRLSVFGGLGFNYEQATMRRTFNHCHFYDGSCFSILLYQNSYTKLSIPTSMTFWFEVADTFYITALVESNWLLRRRITHSEGFWHGFPYHENTFELEDIQIRPGLRYQWQQFVVGFDARVFNFQKVDKILFSPEIEKSWELHNPLRFGVTLSYTW